MKNSKRILVCSSLCSLIAAWSTASALPATLNVPSPYPTIQSAVSAALPGDTVLVGPGTYNENVTITKNIKLLSTSGSAVTVIQGQQAGPELGAILVNNTTTGLQIGDIGEGFTIIGLDGPPGLERAAIYFQGSNSNAKVIGNIVQANGDSGLTTEFGAVIGGFVITDNEFSGQTFLGDTPAGDGFSQQFALANVPRQLVVMGGGNGGGNTSNITFSNNTISGTAGGTNSFGNPQGNNLVTIDSNGLTATKNVFQGFTARFAVSLRARGPNSNITFNDFDGGTPIGVLIGAAAAATSNVNQNRIVGHPLGGVINYSPTITTDATCNWWGASDGPSGIGPGTGDPVGPGVDFAPWLISADLNGPCIGGIAPRVVKQWLVADLQDLLPTGDGKTDKRLEKAIKELSSSLNDKYWVDDSYLTQEGKKVFEDEKQTAKELGKINLPPATITNAQMALIYADQQLAQFALAAAISGNGDPQHIEHAQENLVKAADHLTTGEIDKAIEDYGKAWHHAQEALK